MRRSWCIPAALAVALALSSCGVDEGPLGPQRPAPTLPVVLFILGQRVPLLRSMEQLEVSGEVEAFQIEYGEPMDCPSGCFYASASGLRLGSKIGWLGADDVGGDFQPDSSLYFDLAPGDTALFRSSLWRNWGGPIPDWFRRALLPRVARDPDTPSRALMEIVEDLYSYISPWLASLLLQNPSVQGDRAVLVALASLPVFQGDPYAAERARAQELLDAIGGKRGAWR